MKHSRQDYDYEEESLISSSIKKLRLDAEVKHNHPQHLPINKLFPSVAIDGEPLGDVDYCGVISPILKELAILRRLRNIRNQPVDYPQRQATQIDESYEEEGVAMDETEPGEQFAP